MLQLKREIYEAELDLLPKAFGAGAGWITRYVSASFCQLCRDNAKLEYDLTNRRWVHRTENGFVECDAHHIWAATFDALKHGLSGVDFENMLAQLKTYGTVFFHYEYVKNAEEGVGFNPLDSGARASIDALVKGLGHRAKLVSIPSIAGRAHQWEIPELRAGRRPSEFQSPR